MSASSLTSSRGFHTSYKTRITVAQPSLLDCSLHLLYTLPPHVFVDPYELVHYQHSYTFSHWGTSNLELPAAVVDREGSVVLLNLTLLTTEMDDALNIDIEVPLHARYGEPALLGYYTVGIPHPVVFSACPLSYSGHSQPLPSMPTPLSSLFDSSHVFTSLPENSSAESIRIPVGNYGDLLTVEIGTSLIILLLFFALSHTVYKTADRLSSSHVKAE